MSRTKKQDDDAVKAFNDLPDKSDALRKEELVKAITRNNRTYGKEIKLLADKS